MAITNAHLHWFKLKCPYPQGSKAFRMAKAKLDNATAADLERLRAEFELYKDGSIPVTHYSLYDEWFASVSVWSKSSMHKGLFCEDVGTLEMCEHLLGYQNPRDCS